MDNQKLTLLSRIKDSDIYFSFIKSPTAIISTAIFQREHAKLQKHAIAQGLFAAAKGEGSDKEKQKNLRPSQRSRPQVLLELKQILADTENLTGVLESQLKEIESRGWNRGYC